MNLEAVMLWLAALGAAGGLIFWGLKRWKEMKVGGITLDEITEAIEDAAEKAEEVVEAVEEAVEASKE